MKNISKNSGMSLVEVLIVVALFGIIVGIVGFSFSGYRNSQALSNAENETVALVNEARSRTLAGDSANAYGIHLEASRVVLFVGSSFIDTATSNRVVSFDNTITMTSLSLAGGGSDVIFKKLTGGTDQYGSFVLQQISNPSNQKTININKLGSMSYN